LFVWLKNYTFAVKIKHMRKILWILMAIVMMAGCGEKRHPLLKEAADIIHKNPDSARSLINKVDTSLLSVADRAEYGLLKTITDYLFLPAIDDDSLITTCVDYYDKHGDAWHQGRAYYYRANIRMSYLGKMSDAIKDFKVAETIAEDADDEELKNRVYEQLEYANYYNRNHPLTLKYAHKLLESSIELNDSMMILRSLVICATAHAGMEQMDSAYSYITRILQLKKYADSYLLADIYAIAATMYEEKGDIIKAEEYLKKWKETDSTSYRGYLTLASIRKAQGRYKEAIKETKMGLTDNDYKIRVRSMQLLSELYEITGDKELALEARKQMEACSDSVAINNQTKQMDDWQQKYDERRWEEKSRQRMIRTGAVIAVAFVVLVVGIWWYQRRRVHQLGFRLDENARRITENQAEIERLQQGGEASEQTIADLRRQIEESRQRIASKLLTGTKQFVKLQQKECVGDMTAEERQCLMDYFAQLRPKRWQEWERTYSSLTPSQYVFLILQDDLHYDDDTIAHILDVKPASLRTLRSRIKGRER